MTDAIIMYVGSSSLAMNKQIIVITGVKAFSIWSIIWDNVFYSARLLSQKWKPIAHLNECDREVQVHYVARPKRDGHEEPNGHDLRSPGQSHSD